MKILILGYAGHGKDEVGLILNHYYGLKPTSSSKYAIPKIFDSIKDHVDCTTPEELYEKRDNYRRLLYAEICNYNSPDKSRLACEILQEHDVYVGMRDKEEFDSSEHLFDLIIWVDAYDRLDKFEVGSVNVSPDDADIVIRNNGTVSDLSEKVRKIFDLLIK